MNSGNIPTIRVSDPANLLGLVPYLLGFPPRQSLAILALRAERVLCVARMELPTEPTHHDPYRASLEDLSRVLVRHDATGAILIGYGSLQPVATAVDLATATLRAARLVVHEALRVDGHLYYSLTCTDVECCPPEGTPFDARATVAAATATYAGMVAADNHDDLRARLAPVDGPARDAFAEATAAACHQLLELVDAATVQPGAEPDTSPDTPLGRTLRDTGLLALHSAISCYRQGRRFDDHLAARLTVLLNLPSVRRGAVGHLTGHTWQLDMWSDLVRRAEPDFVAGPANLLTLAALLAGNGALASLAVARALDADPGNSLARLLRQAINAGVSPDEVSTIVAAADRIP
ncbi:MAG TPA: DUF4192 domain-containing protein [Rugosimonospora sp.]|jgi:hypothetical protein